MAQTIISVSREFGSGGHIIAEQIAKDHGLKFYDRHLLDDIAAENNMNAAVLEKYDEKPRNAFLSRRVSGFSNSMEEILAEMQFDYIRKKADSGESFVIVGRGAASGLSGPKRGLCIFLVGDAEAQKKRVEKVYGLNTSEAILKMKRHDKKRRQYHNRHSSFRWGDSRNYDLCINSSKLGLDQTADALEDYIRARISQMQG